jgi:GNAT superfamily N-acetyltransferase
MAITIREAGRGELEQLLPLLLLAEPSASALRWSLRNLSDAAYRMDEGEELVGAATVRWNREPCELVELAVAPGRQGQGLGRRLVAWLIEEARRRGKRELLVGTSSTSAGNIIFYQKCGFRVHEVRPDYFWYYDEVIYEHGLPVRDMLVFRHDLSVSTPSG